MSCSRALVLSALAACGGGGGFPDARPIDAPVPGGTFSVTWTLTDKNGAPLACDKVGGQAVSITAHNIDVQGATTQAFTCSTGMGMSEVLAPGTYNLAFELAGTDGTLDTAPATSIMIQSGQNTTVPPLAFSVDATGGLALKLNAAGASSNCGISGAGILGTKITLTHTTGGACAPVTFNIAAGATKPASTYTVNCTTPVNGPCIENDQTLSVSGVASDGYTISVRANTGTNCWKNDDAFQVPPLGRTLNKTLNLAMASGGC